MKKSIVSTLAAMATIATAPAAIVTFSYTQTDSATGSGQVDPFVINDGNGDINFTATSLSATVFNPNPGLTPTGYVGAQTAQSGASNEPNTLVGLLFSGTLVANGTRGTDNFTVQIPLVFVPKQTQSPDISDYTWNVAFGDNPGLGVDAVSTSLRFAMYLNRDTLIDASESPNLFQRYTQINHTFGAGADSFSNTDTTTTTIKDAFDSGSPSGTDAVGRPLEFYYGWRDQGSLTSGEILIDTFTVGGLLEADESTLVPEPSSALLTGLGVLALCGVRRRAA